MTLLKTIKSSSGKRDVAWIVKTNDHGVCLVVRRTPPKISITTKRSQYVSINESGANEEAGWSLDENLIRMIDRYDVAKVVVFVPKPGIVYTTDARNYRTKGISYMAPKNKSGDRIRCVGLQHFERRHYRVKI